MKIFKKILIVTIIILLSGCSVNYNLKINNDSSVNEEITISDNINEMKSKTGLDEEESIKYLYDMFKREDIKDIFSYEFTGGLAKAKSTTSYDSIDEYASVFSSDIVEKANVEKNDDEITLSYVQSVPLVEKSSQSLVYDDIKVNIEVPFTVTKHNADSVSGNIYTWNIKKDGSLKEISITYKDKEYNDKIRFKIGDNIFNVNYLYIVLFIILFVIGIAFLFVYINNKKNNKV